MVSEKLLGMPTDVIIALTGRCNLTCMYCFYANEMAALSDLPTQTWLTFFEELRDAGVMRVTLSGGEPFTRRDFWQLVDGVVRNKMRFSILTNGTLITDDVAAHLTAYRRRLDFTQVSIDGSCPETHDSIRGKGSFEKTMHGISVLQKNSFPWTARVTINKLNVHDLEAILHLLHDDFGLRSFDINEAFPRGAGQCNNTTLEMSSEERRISFRVMQAFDGKYPGVASGAQAGPLVMANRIDQISHACKTGEFAAPTRTGYLTGCQIMWQKLSVLHDGTYVPCHQLSHISLGQVGKNTLREVWQNSQGLQRLRGRSNIPLESIPHCKGCRYQQYCTGGCPGLAYAIAGEVDTINPLDCYRAYVEEDPVYAY